MRQLYTIIFTLAVLIAFANSAKAQPEQGKLVTIEEIEQYKDQVRLLVRYFEGTLNFLGDPNSSVQEKEIIIYESFSKAFISDKVQIEDDLDENRDVPVNKNIQAYLKDVDFFFKSASFRFDIQSIEALNNEKGEIYFKVTLIRQLNARTVTKDSINANRLRYLEVNLDPFKKDLKIASYYTTRINEIEELRNWWNAMAPEWRNYFGSTAKVYDSIPMSRILHINEKGIVIARMVSFSRKGPHFIIGNDTFPESRKAMLNGRKPDKEIVLNDFVRRPKFDTLKVNVSAVDNRLKQFTLLKEVNIASKLQYKHLEPLSQLSELTAVDFSNTPISDITPLRNLSKLNAINMGATRVFDLTPLQYATNIREVFCNDTYIEDINVLQNFRNLEKLHCFNTKISSLEPLSESTKLTVLRAGGTQISDLRPLSELENLRILEINNTKVKNINPLSGLKALQQLNLNQTMVDDLDPLKNLKTLTTVQFSNTLVNNLSPLQNLPNLKRVYSDKNGVTPVMATAFMRSRPGLLLVFDSDELSAWWNDLPTNWRAVFTEQTGISASPSTEELHAVISLTSLDIRDNLNLKNIQPLSRLVNLQELSMSRTEINDLNPIEGLTDLKKLDISHTRVNRLSALKGLFQLEQLNIENTTISNLTDLQHLKSLKMLWADNSLVNTSEVLEIIRYQPQLLVVYQSESLKFWWTNLSINWQEILAANVQQINKPTPVQLQTIVDQKELVIKNNLSISNIEPLSKLLLLENLVLSGTSVSNLSPLNQLKNLKKLDLSGNPITDLKPLQPLQNIEQLSLESSPVSDLAPIASLHLLKVLNLGGTQIKSLKHLSNLTKLEELAVFNTRLKSLTPVDKLPELKHLKCNNTRIPRKTIDKLRITRPELNVLYY